MAGTTDDGELLPPDPARDAGLDATARAAADGAARGAHRGAAPAGGTPRLAEADLHAAVDALPGLARIAAATWWHTTEWSLRSSVRATRRVARAVTDVDEAAALAADVSGTAHAVADLARAVSSGVPVPRALSDLGADLSETLGTGIEGLQDAAGRARAARHPRPGGPGDGSGATGRDRRHDVPAPPDPSVELRRRGAELLERSRDVWDTSTGHPAHGRILDELAPDEARVLLLLLRNGPQPSVDVRTGGPVGLVSSQLVAPGLTMIGARAGCRWPEQVPSYLNNLFRLGLVWFSREPLRDPMDYQVLEAQPDVLAAVHSVRFAKVVRRSIHLTPFGEDFCRACLVDESTAGAREFPAHALPPEGDAAEPPSQA